MKSAKLRKLKRRIGQLRGSSVKPRKLESLAQALGRQRAKRGSEPTWVSSVFPDLRPLSIPHHSKEVKRFTAESILDQLEMDVHRWEEELKSEGTLESGGKDDA
jgi:hypothetical protein